MAGSNERDGTASHNVVRFPLSRTSPPGDGQPVKDLGHGAMAKIIGTPLRQTTGHWCSHCHGIWFGYPLEVACPVCGNRHG